MKEVNSVHINSRKKEMEHVRLYLCAILRWTEFEYLNHMFECGLEYLKVYIPEDQDASDQIVRTKTFWNWWKNHWHNRNLVFCDEDITSLRLNTRRLLYVELHNPRELALQISPNRVILDLSYAEMIQKIFDEEVFV